VCLCFVVCLGWLVGVVGSGCGRGVGGGGGGGGGRPARRPTSVLFNMNGVETRRKAVRCRCGDVNVVVGC
jgi:hypothetical protein